MLEMALLDSQKPELQISNIILTRHHIFLNLVTILRTQHKHGEGKVECGVKYFKQFGG